MDGQLLDMHKMQQAKDEGEVGRITSMLSICESNECKRDALKRGSHASIPQG